VHFQTDGKITDFTSFYHLPSSIIGNAQHSKLYAVYSYYQIANTVSFESLMRDSLIFARNLGADVYNALDVMENREFLDVLQFGKGNGCLQYYLYNWKCAQVAPHEIGMVLV
jgi:glycylpeptide N-tetradecanoyltransferase